MPVYDSILNGTIHVVTICYLLLTFLYLIVGVESTVEAFFLLIPLPYADILGRFALSSLSKYSNRTS